MKRFEFDEEDAPTGDSGKSAPSTPEPEAAPQPWPGFDPRTLPQADWPFPQVPPKVQQTVSLVIREAIETGLTLHETYARVVSVLARNNVILTSDELSGWVGSNALAVT